MWLLSAGLKLAQHHNYKTPCYTLMIQFVEYPGGDGSRGCPKGGEVPRKLVQSIVEPDDTTDHIDEVGRE